MGNEGSDWRKASYSNGSGNCVEVCSAAFYMDNDPGVLVSACLFGDGAGAAVLSDEPNPRARRVKWNSARTALSAQDRDLLVNELCQFARHAASRSRKAPLVTDSRTNRPRVGGRAWRADRPSQRPSAPPSGYRVRAQFFEQIFVIFHSPR